jgi:hypothetical protein
MDEQDEIFARISARIAAGGESGRATFLKMAQRALDTAGIEGLDQWTALTFFLLPRADQRQVVALLLRIAFKAGAIAQGPAGR